jgi:hypothetical protein
VYTSRYGNDFPYETPFRRRSAAEDFVRFMRQLSSTCLNVRDLQSEDS